MDKYVFANASEHTSPRFAGLESNFDATSRAHLAARGATDGWECWEVGAGSDSVALWLAQRVGPSGRVLASDVDTSRMANAAAPNLRVQRHDVTTDPIPTAGEAALARGGHG